MINIFVLMFIMSLFVFILQSGIYFIVAVSMYGLKSVQAHWKHRFLLYPIFQGWHKNTIRILFVREVSQEKRVYSKKFQF